MTDHDLTTAQPAESDPDSAEIVQAAPDAAAQALIRATLQQRNATIAGLRDDLDRQNRMIAALAGDIRKRDAALRTMADAANDLRGEIAALRASTSWRITAPLRSLVRAWRRWRG